VARYDLIESLLDKIAVQRTIKPPPECTIVRWVAGVLLVRAPYPILRGR
jgi:hypothetical protein